jgi:hypothetical protein
LAHTDRLDREQRDDVRFSDSRTQRRLESRNGQRTIETCRNRAGRIQSADASAGRTPTPGKCSAAVRAQPANRRAPAGPVHATAHARPANRWVSGPVHPRDAVVRTRTAYRWDSWRARPVRPWSGHISGRPNFAA